MHCLCISIINYEWIGKTENRKNKTEKPTMVKSNKLIDTRTWVKQTLTYTVHMLNENYTQIEIIIKHLKMWGLCFQLITLAVDVLV